MSSELPDLDEAISFAVDNGAQAGPFPMQAIIDSVKQGQRLPSTLVWWAGEPDWVPFNSVPGLVALTQDPVETLPPPPSGDPVFGDPAPAGAADATMTFGSAAAAADPIAAEPAMAEPFVAEAATQAFEPEPAAVEPQVAAFEPQAVVEETTVTEMTGFADSGAPGDVIEMGGEVDATQMWAAPEAVQPEADLVQSEGADFSWASPEPSAADDVWADTAPAAEAVTEPAAAESEPESTDGGGLSTGLFGAGAGAVAAAGAAAGGLFSGAGDAVADVTAEGADVMGGVAEAVPDGADVMGAVGDVVPDGGDLAANVEQVMPDQVSPLQSVNERIEALGADSPVASVDADPAEAVAETVEEAAVFEAPVEEIAEPMVEMAETAEPEAVMVEEAPIEEVTIGEPAAVDAFVAEAPAEVEEPVIEEVAEDPVEAVDPAVAAQAALFNDLLDRSAMVEASELRADRKIVVLLAGFMNVAADRGLAVLDMVATGLQHSVRFENPSDGTRTTVALGNAGSHVRMAFGFGTPVEDPGSVLTSTAWDDGPIMIGADTDDGLAFTGVDLYLDPADYVTESNTIDGDALGAMFDALSNELRTSLLDGLGS